MTKRGAFTVVVAMAVTGSVACSSHPAAPRAPGTVPAGTADFTIDGKEVPATHAVDCPPAEQSFTMIRTGDDAQGATLMISNAGKLTVEFVRIRNLNGFTGDYDRGLGGDATVALTQTTYQIAGAAYGFGPNSPEPTTAPFTINVSC